MHDPDLLLLEDDLAAAEDLRDELAKHEVTAEIYDSKDGLLERAAQLKAAKAVLDVKLGAGREREGIETAAALRRLEKRGHEFYIVALTQHLDSRAGAGQAGVDAFIAKTEAEEEALELVLHFEAYNSRVAEHRGAAAASKLVRSRLEAVLKHLAVVSKARVNKKRVVAAQRALDQLSTLLALPLLPRDVRMVLSTIEQLLTNFPSGQDNERKGMRHAAAGVKLVLTAAKNRPPFIPIDSQSLADWVADSWEWAHEMTLNWLEELDHPGKDPNPLSALS